MNFSSAASGVGSWSCFPLLPDPAHQPRKPGKESDLIQGEKFFWFDFRGSGIFFANPLHPSIHFKEKTRNQEVKDQTLGAYLACVAFVILVEVRHKNIS